MTKPLRLPQFLGYATGDAANNLAFSMSSMFLLLYSPTWSASRRPRSARCSSSCASGTRSPTSSPAAWSTGPRPAGASSAPSCCSARSRCCCSAWPSSRCPTGLARAARSSTPTSPTRSSGLAYSLVNIPYGSMATAMTQRPEERAKLATFRVFGSNLTILMLAFVVAPQIKGSDDLQQSLTITTLVFVVVGFALYLFTFLTAREQVERDVAKVTGAPDHRHAQAEPAAAHALPVQPGVPDRHVRPADGRHLLRPRRARRRQLLHHPHDRADRRHLPRRGVRPAHRPHGRQEAGLHRLSARSPSSPASVSPWPRRRRRSSRSSATS